MTRLIAAVAAFVMLALPLRAEVDIKEITTPAGFKAWLVEDHTIPFMALRVAFKGGASLDAPGKRGATNLMTALLEEGTGDLDARGFASATETLAASFSFDASDDSVSISAQVLSENRDEAMVLLRGAIAPQSVALFGHKGITRDDPDFFPAFVASTIFGGGGFNSRLMDEVREKRGLTYGIYAFIGLKDYSQIISGRFNSANDRIADAIEVVKSEWTRFAQEGVTQEELDDAKLFLTGAYPLRFDGNGRIANILVGMQMDGLTADYIATRNGKINAITLDQINAAIARVYLPDSLHFTVVGQPAGL